VAVLFSDSTERVHTEIALREAKEVADKANRAKSEFLSNMSHELRTPLNAILGFGQLIEAGIPPPTPTQKQNIEHILKAGWYLLALVDEILDLALIESGKLALSMEAVSLSEVMRECQAMVEQQAETREIRVSFPRFDAPCHIHADRNRVKQVLSNLLSNAVKYNRPGGSVVVDWVVENSGHVRVSVTDTGDGLSPDRLAQLFQPFNRLGKETSAVQGTGIGLVVSKRVVEIMGGSIGVDSTVGKGSVFWFELNLATVPQSVVSAARAAPVVPAAGQIDAPLRTLLYVEDNPANLTLVEEIISRRPDIRLLTAINGERGIEIARAALPDVILMDINLPGISGIEALKMLAENPATARIPVVALSANAIAGDIETGLGAGFFRYLTKPIKFIEFMDTLDKALEFSIAAARRATIKEQA
jgi:CheY-like chemotaxis protein/anti-sigma regulatory factor (Ser/Thr protein kinase)